MMNARKIGTSVPLQKVLAFLKERSVAGATSREIMEFCGTVAPGTVCSELRSNGYQIDCRYQGETLTGAKVFRYTLVG